MKDNITETENLSNDTQRQRITKFKYISMFVVILFAALFLSQMPPFLSGAQTIDTVKKPVKDTEIIKAKEVYKKALDGLSTSIENTAANKDSLAAQTIQLKSIVLKKQVKKIPLVKIIRPIQETFYFKKDGYVFEKPFRRENNMFVIDLDALNDTLAAEISKSKADGTAEVTYEFDTIPAPTPKQTWVSRQWHKLFPKRSKINN